MPDSSRIQLARDTYRAYETGERDVVEAALADGLEFFSPADVGIDRAAYFERCWPNSERIASFEFKRLFEHGDEVVVTYESETKDGKRFRNTEILGFDGDRISRVEVYFGWNLD